MPDPQNDLNLLFGLLITVCMVTWCVWSALGSQNPLNNTAGVEIIKIGLRR